MMEYKRLTERLVDGTAQPNCSECEHYKTCGDEWYCDDEYVCQQSIYDKLAELEDKIEQGKMIELPCKVGDTIWLVDESWGWIEDKWGSTSEMHEGKAFSFTYYGNCIHVEDDVTSNVYLWGEDAFLTREEAEKRLKELQGDNKNEK